VRGDRAAIERTAEGRPIEDRALAEVVIEPLGLDRQVRADRVFRAGAGRITEAKSAIETPRLDRVAPERGVDVDADLAVGQTAGAVDEQPVERVADFAA
jgi:hypothetical protein